MMGEGAQTNWGPLWTTHGLVRVGSGPDSTLWTAVGHCPDSWSLAHLDVFFTRSSGKPLA